MTRLKIAPYADALIEREDRWWRKNRTAAPLLFAHELAEALKLLATTPALGTPYAVRRGIPIRRMLLQRSRYHVYFAHHEDANVVEIRAVWHASRRRGPRL